MTRRRAPPGPKSPPRQKRSNVAMPATKEEWISSLKSMSVMELHELVEALKEEFGVSAAVPMAVGGAAAAGGDGAAAAPEVEEKTSFDVILMAAGDKKINVIKA